MTAVAEWISERRRIHSAATEGLWAVDGPAQAGPDDSLVVYPKDDAGAIAYVQPAWDDADSIVDAHNTLPTVLTALEKVLELHQPINGFVGDPSHWECNVCGDERGPKPYPCPTVRAIEGAIK